MAFAKRFEIDIIQSTIEAGEVTTCQTQYNLRLMLHNLNVELSSSFSTFRYSILLCLWFLFGKIVVHCTLTYLIYSRMFNAWCIIEFRVKTFHLGVVT